MDILDFLFNLLDNDHIYVTIFSNFLIFTNSLFNVLLHHFTVRHAGRKVMQGSNLIQTKLHQRSIRLLRNAANRKPQKNK